MNLLWQLLLISCYDNKLFSYLLSHFLILLWVHKLKLNKVEGGM